jgi:hypothetical protein
VGKAYDLTSTPFEVVPATLGVTVTRAGTEFSAAVRLHAPKGYRLLDMDLASNAPVPVRAGSFTVTLAGTTLGPQTVAITADGDLVVDAAAEADSVTAVTIVDAYGNSRTVTVP